MGLWMRYKEACRAPMSSRSVTQHCSGRTHKSAYAASFSRLGLERAVLGSFDMLPFCRKYRTQLLPCSDSHSLNSVMHFLKGGASSCCRCKKAEKPHGSQSISLTYLVPFSDSSSRHCHRYVPKTREPKQRGSQALKSTSKPVPTPITAIAPSCAERTLRLRFFCSAMRPLTLEHPVCQANLEPT